MVRLELLEAATMLGLGVCHAEIEASGAREPSMLGLGEDCHAELVQLEASMLGSEACYAVVIGATGGVHAGIGGLSWQDWTCWSLPC